MNISGTLFSGNIPVVEIENNEIIDINKKLAPLYFQKYNDINMWLNSRAIDSHRVNSRLLKKVLRLSEKDDINTVLSVNAVTITDNYWFKQKNENLTWNDVKFKENIFDNLALTGDPNAFSQKPSRTPELTNIGSYEKCWKLIDGKWWLFKNETENELFSELFVYNLGCKLHFNMAYYKYDNGYIKSLDFTNNATVNYEPISSILGDNEDYELSFNYFLNQSEEIAKDYLRMIYLDSICFNMDRHTQNYGVLRNTETGEIIGLAPNFDNNISLIARGYPNNINRENDGLLKFLFEFLNKNPKAKEMLISLDIPKITESMVQDCINNIPVKVDDDFIVKFIHNGQLQIDKFLK